MSLTSRTAYLLRCRQGGLARAAYWAKLGHPNLKLATAAHMRNAAARRAAKELEQRRKELGLDIDDPPPLPPK